jgi:hypothetical protein
MSGRSEDFGLPFDLRSVERNDCLSPCLVRAVVAWMCHRKGGMPIVLVVEDEILIRELVAEELAEADTSSSLRTMPTKRSPFSKPVRISISSLPISTCPVPWMG